MRRIPKSSRQFQDSLDIKFKMFGQAVSKIYDCFGLCNVMTAFDPPFERLLLAGAPCAPDELGFGSHFSWIVDRGSKIDSHKIEY